MLSGAISSIADFFYRSYNYLLGDMVKIIRYQEGFILGELTDRALQSESGYAQTYIGLPFAKIYNFVVLTNEQLVKEGAAYGEFSNEDPQHYDSKARSLFDPLKNFLGMESIINQNGPEVPKERAAIKTYLTAHKGLEASIEIFQDTVRRWDQNTSINHMICYACSRVIASAWFNLKELPEEVVPLLKKAEHAVFNADKISADELRKLKLQFKALNQRAMTDNREAILGTNNYLKHLLESGKANSLEELNALSALVVEGNITTLVTCAVIQLASSKDLQRQLRDSLKEVNLENANTLEDISRELKKCDFLNNIYHEALRFFAPAPPVVRYCSKASNIGGVNIPARSFVFMPFRRIMHDPKLWQQPEVFDPSRPQYTKMKANVYPLNPFSVGQRVCPASFGFAEAMFKIALISLFKDNELSLTSHETIEPIPASAKEPRLKQEYFATMNKVAEEPYKPYIPAFYSRRTPIVLAKSAPSTLSYELQDNEVFEGLSM